jgi:hypothetical protein
MYEGLRMDRLSDYLHSDGWDTLVLKYSMVFHDKHHLLLHRPVLT